MPATSGHDEPMPGRLDQSRGVGQPSAASRRAAEPLDGRLENGIVGGSQSAPIAGHRRIRLQRAALCPALDHREDARRAADDPAITEFLVVEAGRQARSGLPEAPRPRAA